MVFQHDRHRQLERKEVEPSVLSDPPRICPQDRECAISNAGFVSWQAVSAAQLVVLVDVVAVIKLSTMFRAERSEPRYFD